MKSWRFTFLKLFFVFLLAGLTARLLYWQIVSYERLAVAATEQHLTTVRIDSPRGRIFAADGNLLVSNQTAFLLYASIPEIKKDLEQGETYEKRIEAIVNQIQPVLLEEEISKLREPGKLSRRDKETLSANLTLKIVSQLLMPEVVWVPLANKVPLPTKEKIGALRVKGLGFENQSERFYPEGTLAANLLGFVGKDTEGNDKGYLGLEGFYQDQLQGQSGKLTQEVDASGHPIIAVDTTAAVFKNGLDIETTLDRTVQYTLEKYLFDSARKYGAKEASGIVLDPRTGQILAMANFPAYDSGKWEQFKDVERRNSAISTIYEPGSTFKVITASAALDTGAVKTDTICPCDGPIKKSGYEVQTWNNKYNPNSNMAQILQHSDNVGAAFWAEKLGKTAFLEYLKKFGLGAKTDIDLQGEETGLIKKSQDWSEIDLVTNAFGQGVSVTSLQMASAVSVIANGGKLMKPYVVRKIITPEREIVNNPKEVRQVIKPETAGIMKELMLSAVEQGEAKRIIPKGYRVGGKTGTAQIPLGGKYDPNKTVASFVGFGPIEDPRFVMLIKYVEPVPIYGAETAEPTFFKIAQELYTYWGIEVR